MWKQPEDKKNVAAQPQAAGRQAPAAALTFAAMFAQIGRTLDIAAAAHANDSAHLRTLQDRIAELEQQVRGLDGRFTKILEERFKQAAPETPTSDLQEHYDLADAFKKFFTDVDLELSDIYSRAANTRPTDAQRARWIAELLSYEYGAGRLPRIEAELLAHQPDDSTRDRIGLLISHFEQLRSRATELDPAHVFTFEFSPGRIDPSTQQAWRRCDPEGNVEFVVTPAYGDGRRVFLRQEVFTVSRKRS